VKRQIKKYTNPHDACETSCGCTLW